MEAGISAPGTDYCRIGRGPGAQPSRGQTPASMVPALWPARLLRPPSDRRRRHRSVAEAVVSEGAGSAGKEACGRNWTALSVLVPSRRGARSRPRSHPRGSSRGSCWGRLAERPACEDREVTGDLPLREAARALVRDDVRGQGSEQGIDQRSIAAQAGLAEQRADVQGPSAVGAGPVAALAGLAGQGEVAMALEQLDHGPVEGRQALGGRRPRAERWRPAQQLILQCALVLVEQGPSDRGDVRIAAVERALTDARRERDLLHRHLATAALCKQPVRGLEHTEAVAGRVGSLSRGARSSDRELHGAEPTRITGRAVRLL